MPSGDVVYIHIHTRTQQNKEGGRGWCHVLAACIKRQVVNGEWHTDLVTTSIKASQHRLDSL